MGILDFFRSDKKKKTERSEEREERKEKPYEGSWEPDTLTDDTRQAEQVEEEKYHVVQEGESLSQIAEKYYGNPEKSQLIYDANQDQIDNPDLIHTGQRLFIPGAE